MPTRFEKHYCDECWCEHWVEVTETRREICHGKDYLPKESATHYTRWKAGGIELVQKSTRQRQEKIKIIYGQKLSITEI